MRIREPFGNGWLFSLPFSDGCCPESKNVLKLTAEDLSSRAERENSQTCSLCTVTLNGQVKFMKNFWDDLKHSDAFSFSFTETGEIVQAEQTDYFLYDTDLFPFIVFADELRSLNDYCYRMATAVQQELDEWTGSRETVKTHPSDTIDSVSHFTNYDLLLSLEAETDKWEWIQEITVAHLVILLYSYLEKTVKYIYKLLKQNNKISVKSPIERPYLYSWLYSILGISKNEFPEQYPEIYDILEQCRKIRNNFAHDNLEGASTDGDGDYVYETRKLVPSFRLIDSISAITFILDVAEKVYRGDT